MTQSDLSTQKLHTPTDVIASNFKIMSQLYCDEVIRKKTPTIDFLPHTF